MQSFTSLTQNRKSNFNKFLKQSSELQNAHTLPTGIETGIMLHKILENIPFYLGLKPDVEQTLIPFINHFVQNTSFTGWSEVIAEIIMRNLTTKLPGESFCLADVDENKKYRECEFLYSSHKNYLTGTIDLCFEHQGKYYLVDWKSNWLGCETEKYHLQAMEESIISNHYDLQADIYIEGLRRYLQLFYKEPFEDLFGGIYYLFLRGVGPKTGIWKRNV
jgi:exodeoxyribonuclease V beta subunit